MTIVEYLKSFSPMELGNAFICMGIALRLMIFRQGSARHKFWYSVFAYVLIVSSAAIAIRILMKHYIQVDLWELVLNSSVLLGVLLARGNVGRLLRN